MFKDSLLTAELRVRLLLFTLKKMAFSFAPTVAKIISDTLYSFNVSTTVFFFSYVNTKDSLASWHFSVVLAF